MSIFQKLFFLLICSVGLCAQPEISVSKEISLIDEEIGIEISKLEPGHDVELVASFTDCRGKKWISKNVFKADVKGKVNLQAHAPLSGTYAGVDPMGIFWSMERMDGIQAFPIIKKPFIEVDLKASLVTGASKKGDSSQVVIKRQSFSPNVQRIEVREDGLVGTLFMPRNTKGPLPLVITLTGSSGGVIEGPAALLASRGIASFALGYFAAEGLPSNLEHISLEYFERAFDWVKKHPKLDESSLSLYGVSRGAELSLVLGSLFPDRVHRIVATHPSSVVYGALDFQAKPAWIYKGKPFSPNAPIPAVEFSETLGVSQSQPLKLASLLLAGLMQYPKKSMDARIPVENFKGDVMLISGGDDQMWPARRFAEQIVGALGKKAVHLSYPEAGHGISIPFIPGSRLYFHPLKERWFTFGGSMEADSKASQDSWKKVLSFLEAESSL